ncbi:50S ribosomal protein L24 [Thermanaerothrix daxensis]|uniref:Large ribosomal subunit protein uL24 n=1 Tax=Thermanaerothrix daxensis TaxID=869279 RepID=A0A0P6YMX0_9CHLR|nr:50S ribosomal protein L24 [Thermanaerothrix daxensis]KPL84089.1 50S ribosomal protein L24 [Thermanaerothrix daxensis]
MKVKIRKGDTVEVISGRREDKGKRGEVIRVLPKEARVVVQGVNIRTKHQRQVQAQGRTISPGRVRFEAPVHISNVMLVCPKCGKATRVGISRGEDGKARRVCKKCQALIDE